MTVYLRGQSWLVDFAYTDSAGVERRFRQTAGKKKALTRKQVEDLERQWKMEVEAAPVEVAEAAFSGFAKHWFDNYVVTDMKPTTARSYQRNLRMHIVPAFGDVDMRAVTVDKVQRVKAELLKTLSPKSVKNILGIVSAMFTKAIALGYCDRNPVLAVKPPRLDPQEMAFWTREQSDIFLAHTRETEPRWWLYFLLALRTGLRVGELAGLRWSDVHLESKQILVARSFSEGKVTTPKSGRSRVVPMPSDLVAALRVAPRRLGSNQVFWREDGGPVVQSVVFRRFKRLAAEAGVPVIRLHDLRHTYASQLVMAGVPLKAVQEYLGHSDITTTLRYSHLAPSEKASWVDALCEDLRHKSRHNGGDAMTG